ncbi:sigma-70 family RNA polymerase sigma factor [Stieleria sp. ICT_E10.1]|uniref:sigma-70 family RNA polymerase sigma factor n=1 Tax=Stieleria sedimenti TaxID=2976331 RepID=UPI00217F56F0|nr:sigma-70 family RNA polymerase sigma factor [Stieleria sedimenti]MCS7466726.1 sigma-70 family RNA polymerase sigma factor [Stieleria sedimenti]
MTDVTKILSAIEQADPAASAELLPLVYDELRHLAARELSGDRSGHSIQPTALVHQAYVRLVDQTDQPLWNHRGHFYAAAAEAMRRILVEHARRKQTLKRGGDRMRVPLDANRVASSPQDPDILELDEALTRLAVERPKLAKLVSLRYFAGLTMDQTANALQVSRRTAERDWTYAKVWLLDAMRGEC